MKTWLKTMPPKPAVDARKIEGARKQALETGRTRLLVTGMVLTLAFVAVFIRLIDVSVMDNSGEPRVTRAIDKAPAVVKRADIVDRNGVVLATNLPTVSLYADPKMFIDAKAAAKKLVAVMPQLEEADVYKKLTGKGRFVWLARNLTPDEHYAVNKLGVPGFAFLRSEKRIYPNGSLSSQLLGVTDVDGRGISGLEDQFDGSLNKGDVLRLSLDVRVQDIMRRELQKSMDEFKAVGASGVVMDVTTGEVISSVSLPDFNPNVPLAAKGEASFNRATKGLYEMGSTFKLFTAAMALDSGAADINSIYDATEPLKAARFVIRDYHGKKRPLSLPEVIVYSSNIGSAKMALDVGTLRQQQYLKRFGLLQQTALEIPETSNPLRPEKWREINTMTISYGHGIAVSPVHLASGVATLVNGGVRYPATLLKVDGKAKGGVRVVSEKTSLIMRQLMRLVVTRGTGKNADAKGYLVGGKTGTADKPDGGKYTDRALISSFVAAFPLNNPRYVVFALLDEPVGNKRTFNFATGGWVAAPVIKKVIDQIAPMLGVAPDLMAELETPFIPDDKKMAKLAKKRRAEKLRVKRQKKVLREALSKDDASVKRSPASDGFEDSIRRALGKKPVNYKLVKAGLRVSRKIPDGTSSITEQELASR